MKTEEQALLNRWSALIHYHGYICNGKYYIPPLGLDYEKIQLAEIFQNVSFAADDLDIDFARLVSFIRRDFRKYVGWPATKIIEDIISNNFEEFM